MHLLTQLVENTGARTVAGVSRATGLDRTVIYRAMNGDEVPVSRASWSKLEGAFPIPVNLFKLVDDGQYHAARALAASIEDTRVQAVVLGAIPNDEKPPVTKAL